VIFAIVRAASWLVPAEARAEWLAEWRAEFLHVAAAARGRTVAAFCVGAIPDAVWLRRSAPRAGVEPALCLLLLAALAAAGALVPHPGWLSGDIVSISTAGSRRSEASVTYDQYRILAARPTFASVAFYRVERRGGRWIAAATGSLRDVLGSGARRRYWQLPQRIDAFEFDAAFAPETRGFVLARMPAGAGHPARWPVYAPAAHRLECITLTSLTAAETHLLMIALALLAVGAATAISPGPFSRSWTAAAWAFLIAKMALAGAAVALACPPTLLLFGYTAAFAWAALDQRRRCPVCLRRLVRPVSIGSASHALLDWYGAEWMCARGHGLLYEPDTAVAAYSAPRWQRLDASWRALFRSA
jgi:hypothetical protein